ncbi:hypothetical protein G6F46_014315 [Rhizopus delemar]|nr:hypothetical protein G6F46_014315 [Rhizopus delemar]
MPGATELMSTAPAIAATTNTSMMPITPVHAPRHAFLLAHHHRIHRGADGGDGGRAEVAAVAITLVALVHGGGTETGDLLLGGEAVQAALAALDAPPDRVAARDRPQQYPQRARAALAGEDVATAGAAR